MTKREIILQTVYYFCLFFLDVITFTSITVAAPTIFFTSDIVIFRENYQE